MSTTVSTTSLHSRLGKGTNKQDRNNLIPVWCLRNVFEKIVRRLKCSRLISGDLLYYTFRWLCLYVFEVTELCHSRSFTRMARVTDEQQRTVEGTSTKWKTSLHWYTGCKVHYHGRERGFSVYVSIHLYVYVISNCVYICVYIINIFNYWKNKIIFLEKWLWSDIRQYVRTFGISIYLVHPIVSLLLLS